MTNDIELKSPSEYLPRLEKLRQKNPYAKHWKLCIECRTNRHYDQYNRSCGWYEVWPIGVIVGYWSYEHNDLKQVNIALWNEEAAKIS